jgi:hypothetical protein
MNEKQDLDRIPVGEIKTSGSVWEVSFHSRTHQFWAKSPGFHEINSRTWEDLEAQVKKRVAKARVKVSIPYVIAVWVREGDIKAPTLVSGTATGIHGGTGKILATQGGRNRSLEAVAYGRDGYMTPFTEGEQERFLDLLKRRRQLDEMIKAIEEEHKWDGRNLRAAVEKEVEEARIATMAEGDDGEPGHDCQEAGDL